MGNEINKTIPKKKLIKFNDKLKNIKSKYILQKVFNNLEKSKSLTIIKYNKIIKDRLEIDINDYKEYSENYSSIEIELKPLNNKYSEFIILIKR